MSKILIRKEAGTEVELRLHEDGFWWVRALAESQRIPLHSQDIYDGQNTVFWVTDDEAPRLVSLLEFAANPANGCGLRDWQAADCRRVAEFTRGGGWETVA